MIAYIRLLVRLISAAALIMALELSALPAQDSELEEIKYNEDYNRMKRITSSTDIMKRGEQFVSFYRERPDMRPDLREYLDSLFAKDMDTLLKQQNFKAIKSFCERATKARPRFGEAHLFLGVALKNENRGEEAMLAFAKGAGLDGPPARQKQAKQQLDVMYRATHKGSLIGEDKYIKEAIKGLK